MKNTTRLLIGALCAVVLVVLGISKFGHRETITAKPIRAAQPQAAIPETPPAQTPDAKEQSSESSVQEVAGLPAISTFRQWAETTTASGISPGDQIIGMKLAKARAAAMKALIQQDPVAALRQALPADVRKSLPAQIAAVIEQPIKKAGTCALRLACNHSDGSSHEECHATPILTGVADSWNAYYGDPQWETLVGQDVEFEGISVEGELAVQTIGAAPLNADP